MRAEVVALGAGGGTQFLLGDVAMDEATLGLTKFFRRVVVAHHMVDVGGQIDVRSGGGDDLDGFGDAGAKVSLRGVEVLDRQTDAVVAGDRGDAAEDLGELRASLGRIEALGATTGTAGTDRDDAHAELAGAREGRADPLLDLVMLGVRTDHRDIAGDETVQESGRDRQALEGGEVLGEDIVFLARHHLGAQEELEVMVAGRREGRGQLLVHPADRQFGESRRRSGLAEGRESRQGGGEGKKGAAVHADTLDSLSLRSNANRLEPYPHRPTRDAELVEDLEVVPEGGAVDIALQQGLILLERT